MINLGYIDWDKVFKSWILWHWKAVSLMMFGLLHHGPVHVHRDSALLCEKRITGRKNLGRQNSGFLFEMQTGEMKPFVLQGAVRAQP